MNSCIYLICTWFQIIIAGITILAELVKQNHKLVVLHLCSLRL
jgi:hypothetical protein